jgi:hypothetical protein
MAISKPGGRFGAPDSKPGGEKKARSDKSYQTGVDAGFSLTGKASFDETAVKAKSPIMVEKGKMPSTNGDKGFQSNDM